MQENAFIQFLVENALEVIIIFKENGIITYANKSAAEQLQYEGNMQGCLMQEAIPELFKEAPLHLREELLDAGIYSLTAYRKNRTCFPIRGRLMKYEAAVPLYIFTGYNNTEREYLKRQVCQAGVLAEEAGKVKSEFVANVTHELRTPVNGILGNTRELLSIEQEENRLKLLHLIERGCKDMNSIINNILDFSKLDAGKFTLESREFNFRSMIDYVKSNHKNKIIEKGLDFFVTVSPDIPEMVIGDELRIVQVLNNLLSNACKFTTVGKIMLQVVKTAQIDNKIELFFLVVDSGIGIDKADQDKLFQSFSQVDASISRQYGGTGLGLYICKQLVELMNGKISVQSEQKKGTVFSFSIWLQYLDGEQAVVTENAERQEVLNRLYSLYNDAANQSVWIYGEPENLEELRKKLSKLILSVEMENWEKAEMFAETIKQLTMNAPPRIKTTALKMKMAVQKEDYEKAAAAFEALQTFIRC